MATLKQNSEALKAITNKLKNLPKRAVLTDLVVTKNGEYAPEDENSGFKRVTVEVASGGGDFDAFIEGTLTEVSSGVTKIGDNAFHSHKSIKTVSFPNATSIGKAAFHSCSGITSANFPNATSIGDSAFRDCVRFTSLNFPKVTSIADSSAFYNCNDLTSIDFSNLTSIGTYAFSSCTMLIAVILRSETLCTLANKNAFNNTYHIIGGVHVDNPNGDKDGYFYVPRALLSDDDATKDYRRATNWADFATQFRALEDYTVDGTITGDLDPNKL